MCVVLRDFNFVFCKFSTKDERLSEREVSLPFGYLRINYLKGKGTLSGEASLSSYFADFLNIDLLCFRNKCFTFRVGQISEGACCAKKQT